VKSRAIPEKYWIPGQVQNDKKEKTTASFHEVFDIWQFGIHLDLEL
jgi:hypothetical protein